MSKQTAVEWLVDKWSTQGTLHSSDIPQAKEMEKEQLVYAVNKENSRCTNIANDVIKLINSDRSKELFRPDEQIGEITYKQLFEIK